MIFIVCGVSGTGKTTVGMRLAESLGVPFYDADDFHPRSNIAKMESGVPLTEKDREPWLNTLAARIAAWQEEGDAVLACSALRESYRETLSSGRREKFKWVFLIGDKDVLAERLASRPGHFFNRNLLKSQLDALEVPEYAVKVDVNASPGEIVKTILQRHQVQ